MEISRNWRLQKQRYGLWGEICPNEHKIFPPRDVCPYCAEEAKTPYQFSGKGEVYSYSTVYDAPEGHEEQAPYTVANIKLAEGPLITAQLTDIDRAITTPDGKVILLSQETVSEELLAVSRFGLVDVNGNSVDIGTPVEMVTRKLSEDGPRGQIVYGYMFRPLMVDK